jgi:hypothetical protein
VIGLLKERNGYKEVWSSYDLKAVEGPAMNRTFWNPGVFHGGRQDQQFFEGWYYKLISPDRQERWAVIPGVFHHPDPNLRHAFIQVLDGIRGKVVYHRFPVGEFQGSGSEFLIKIANNHFHARGITLDLEDERQRLSGELIFDDLKPWPIRLLSPGVMGLYRFAPFMQTYHGVLSMDHTIQGSMKFDGRKVDFSGGRGYIEKDWGKTFPRAYIWMQTNHFIDQGVSLTASVATIPWLRGWFRGFLVGLLIDGELYRFTTYLGSEIFSLIQDDQHVTWILNGSKRTASVPQFHQYQLSIRAERSGGGLLSSPELDGMTPRILESLTAEVHVELKGIDKTNKTGQVIYQGLGTCGGLEVAGSVEEITEPVRDDQG